MPPLFWNRERRPWVSVAGSNFPLYGKWAKFMATRTNKTKVKKEYERLSRIYSELPESTREFFDGLFHEAARLRVLCDEYFEDIQKNGKFEPYERGGMTYERERECSKAYRDTDRLYQALIKTLDDKLPKEETKSGFSKIDDDD